MDCFSFGENKMKQLKGKLTAAQIGHNIILSSRLCYDWTPLWCLFTMSRWNATKVAEALVKAQACTITKRSVRDGSVMEIELAKPITIAEIEAICLTPRRIKRADRIKKYDDEHWSK
jgi:hypothetical protein